MHPCLVVHLTTTMLVTAVVASLAKPVVTGAGNDLGETQAPAAEQTRPVQRLGMPPWAEVQIVNPVDEHALEKGGREFVAALGGLPRLLRPGFGPSSGIQVSLSSGIESYLPAPDLTGRSPNGIEIPFQRCYRSDRALAGYGSPGLSSGWVHNFDVVIQPVNHGGAWSELCIVYPNGERDYMKPHLAAGGTPTGQFAVANHAPFTAVGEPGGEVNLWKAVVVRWSGSAWVFRPLSKDLYVLAAIDGNRLEWDDRRALQAVIDVQSTRKLLNLTYDANGHLSAVTDSLGRMRTYEFGVPGQGGGTKACLVRISQLFRKGEAVPMAQWAFDYSSGARQPLLHSISVPSPTGKGVSTCSIVYQDNRVAAHVDGNGNERRYTYGPGRTLVQVVNPAGKVEEFWYQNLDALGRNTGTTDALGHTETIGYGPRGQNP